MIIYYLHSSELGRTCDADLKTLWNEAGVCEDENVEFVSSFPYRYQKEMVEVCCEDKKVLFEVKMKNLIREYNIEGLTEIGVMVASPSCLWIMDRWTRRIYTIQDHILREKDFGVSYHKPLRAVTISTYTTHAIILMEDIKTGETYLFGDGSNLHNQLKFGDNVDLSQPIFIPHEEVDPTSRITHISCSYPFSVCVINDRDIHISGQNWLKHNGGTIKWKNVQFKCPEDVISLKSGNFHFIAILKDYSIVSGGSNGYNETTHSGQKQHVVINPVSLFPVISMTLGSYCSLLKSKSGTFHMYGRSTSDRFPDNQFKERLCILEDKSRTIPYDEVFLERDHEVLHYKENGILLIMYNNPAIVKYSDFPIPSTTFEVLPCGIVFYSKGSHNFQQLLLSSTNPSKSFISDVSVLCSQ